MGVWVLLPLSFTGEHDLPFELSSLQRYRDSYGLKHNTMTLSQCFMAMILC